MSRSVSALLIGAAVVIAGAVAVLWNLPPT